MTKGVSEKFDEHERDTARREYPREIVEGTKRTAKIAKVDLNELRTESGTRPAITRDLIEKIRDALPHHALVSSEDAHSRPTIELTTVTLTVDDQGQPLGVDPSTLPTAPPPSEATTATPFPTQVATPTAIVSPSSSSSISNEKAPARSPIATWVVGMIVVGIALMLSAAGAVGFFFGRRTR